MLALQPDRGEDSALVRAGVDADAIGLFVHAVRNRVAVNHHHAVIDLARQEILADPAQVLVHLILQREAGANAGMDEQIVADRDHPLARVEEPDMVARDAIDQQVAQVVEVALVHLVGRQAVTEQRRIAADRHQSARGARAALCGGDENLLMIAFQQSRPAGAQLPDALDHAGRVRAAIDQVAQEHQGRLRRPARGIVGVDHVDQPVEFVGASVHIADRIDAFARRNGVDARLGLAGAEEHGRSS